MIENQEIWKPTNNPNYEVSNLGRIRSLDVMVRCRGGFRSSRSKILKPTKLKVTGYCQVSLSGVPRSVHSVVAHAFCQGYFQGAVVDHLNGIRDDNRAENLEWVTNGENIRRGYVGKDNWCKGLFSDLHPTSKSVTSTCLKSGEIIVWKSAMDAVRVGFDSSCISRCCNGKINTHKGHTWKFSFA